MKKNNVIIFSEYFIKKRIIKEGKIYSNEIVGECVECNGEGIILESYPEEICVGFSDDFPIISIFPFRTK